MKGHKGLWFPLLGLIAIAGCGSKDAEKSYAPMGDSSPAYGSTKELSSLAGFMAGRWCLTEISDMEFAKQLHVEALAAQPDLNKDWWYEFKSEGTFKCGDTSTRWQVEGTFAVQGDTAMLTYKTMEGRTIQEAQHEYAKKEESGRASAIGTALIMDSVFKSFQLWVAVKVAPDQKHLLFVGTSQSVPGASADAPPMGAKGLERMQEKKE